MSLFFKFPLNSQIKIRIYEKLYGFHSWVQADIQEKGEERESRADEMHDQEPDTETMELLTLIEKYPAVILTLLVRTRDPKQELGYKKLPTIKRRYF